MSQLSVEEMTGSTRRDKAVITRAPFIVIDVRALSWPPCWPAGCDRLARNDRPIPLSGENVVDLMFSRQLEQYIGEECDHE
jgi:hypothetical protein